MRTQLLWGVNVLFSGPGHDALHSRGARPLLGTVAYYFLFYKSANRTFGLLVSFRLNKAEGAKELNCANRPR